MTDILVLLFLAVVFLALYFTPSLIAARRRHHQAAPIFIINLVFGWTIVGWFVALIWAVAAVKPAPAQARPGSAP